MKYPVKSKIRKDGRDGLFLACNSDNEEILSSEAIPRETYYCPICKIPMHLSHSVTGEPFFACNPGHSHTTEFCMSSNGNLKFFKKSPEQEIAKFCQPDRARASDGSDEDASEQGNPTGKDGDANGAKEKTIGISEITALSQLHSGGICYFDPNTIIKKHLLSDYILSFKSFDAFFSSPDFQLGARIVLARVSSYDKNKKTLHFKIFQPKNDSQKYPVKEIHILVNYKGHTDVFNEHIKKILERTPDGSMHIKKEKDALIACTHWKKVDNYTYEAIYKGSKQIWFAPDEQREEKNR